MILSFPPAKRRPKSFLDQKPIAKQTNTSRIIETTSDSKNANASIGCFEPLGALADVTPSSARLLVTTPTQH